MTADTFYARPQKPILCLSIALIYEKTNADLYTSFTF